MAKKTFARGQIYNMQDRYAILMKKNILYGIILIILIAAGFSYYNARKAQPAGVAPKTTISQSELADTYGLRVNLIAVTAAGGMVDVRFKMLDGAKARLLLQDKKNFPALYIASAAVTLNASPDAQAGEIKFEDGGNLFLMIPNSGGAVKPGTPVSVLFGDTILEPIEAK